jgi:zinc transport system substrate-binding protein
LREARHIAEILVLSAILLAGCTGNAGGGPADALQVTVSIPPQSTFVKRVGGEHVEVNVMVPAGASPATYEPTPAQLRALSEADAYVSISVPFEDAWLDRFAAANPDMTMVDTTKGIDRIGSPKHPDPHIWLSPKLVKVQAQTICDALAALDPAHAENHRANLDEFLGDVDALDRDIRETLEGVERRRFMVFHPSWGYFARDYGLEMVPIEVGGQEPSAAELGRLVTLAKEQNIHVIFAQPEFSTQAAETIAQEINGEVLLISPLAEDWFQNMRRVAETLEQQLG